MTSRLPILLLCLFGAAHAADPASSPLPGVPLARESALVASVYERSGQRPLWSRDGRLTAQAHDLVVRLGAVEDVGLSPAEYGADELAAGTTPSARLDEMLTRAALRLVTHLHYGRIEPRAAGFELPEPRRDLDVVATVVALAAAPKVDGALAAVEPGFYHYGLLKAALARYRILAADPTQVRLPAYGRRSLRPGDAYAGAAALRSLLRTLGDLAPAKAGAPEGDVLDQALSTGLRAFQDRHGLTADGTLGAATFAALTTPLPQRVRQIELTLERWRWLPAFDSAPIIVNIPQYRLFAFETIADRAEGILQIPVIVGQTYLGKRTPVFVGDMKYVIFRPYWDVPRSITLNEMLPAIHAHPDYLARNHLELVRGEGDDGKVEEPTPEAIAALAAGRLRLRQRPGEDNALGLIKFVFPNAHNVYMHSTPAHRLFEQSRRAFSHGCIRVSDPVALAQYVLLRAEGTWSAARIEGAMHDSDARRITLREPIHVMVLYATALATEAGPVDFFDDIYGHDRRLERLLHLKPVPRARE